MSEIAFPILGTIFFFAMVLPGAAVVAKVALVIMERRHAHGPLHGLHARYVVLSGASLIPIAWFLSAGLHQAETGRSVVACLFDHEAAAACFEPALFVGSLGLVLLACVAARLRGIAVPAESSSPCALALRARLVSLATARRLETGIVRRIRITAREDFALATSGLMRPYVTVGEVYGTHLDDDALVAAIAHEAEHVKTRDPLRYVLLDVALAMNPLGRVLLEPHAASWLGAREAHCDREAVVQGANPLALAHAIVRAARPTRGEAVALGARDTGVLKLRIGLLLAFAEQRPARCCHRRESVLSIALVMLALASLLPHQTGTAALDALHTGAEHTLQLVLR